MKAANTATSADNRGRKRKSELTLQDDDESLGHDEHPPAKKGKGVPVTEQLTRPVPRRVQKPLEVVPGEEATDLVNRCNTKKRPNEAAADMAHESDPKTPVPSKRAKIGPNEKSKVAPIRRTGKPIFFSARMKLITKLETMIELVGSKVVARRPTDIDLETVPQDDAAMPNLNSRAPTEDVDTDSDIYQTPVALTPANRKNKARLMAEHEEVTIEELEEKKKGRALISAPAPAKVYRVCH